ncbi:MAG TPA: hypothetical protein VF691_08185, partial [Cytophagaceae bacterium]
MDTSYHIEKALLDPATMQSLAEVTVDVVKNGASVGFMHPFTEEKALIFWNKVKPRVESGDVILLIARES